MARRKVSRPLDNRVFLGAAATVVLLLGVWSFAIQGEDDSSSTAGSPNAAVSPPTVQPPPTVQLPSTAPLPMNTTEPFHQLPDPQEWRDWLTLNADSFAKARAHLSVSSTQNGAGSDGDAAVRTWTAALLAGPIPADPIGQRLTASMNAFLESARSPSTDSKETSAVVDDGTRIKAYTLLQTVISELELLGVVPTA